LKETGIIEILDKVAKGISETFGSNCEVLIADLNNIENPIISIYNGHVTGRKLGDAISELGMRTIKERKADRDLISYHATTVDGRLLKCSSFHFKHDRQWLSLGINYDYTNMAMAHSTLENFIEIKESIEDKFLPVSSEAFENLLQDVIKQIGKPPYLMNKKERVKLVKYLDDKGVLIIKKGIQMVAEALNVSRYTIYNYLKEIKEENKKNNESD
jgi:predicted transcriptional regulator YheO